PSGTQNFSEFRPQCNVNGNCGCHSRTGRYALSMAEYTAIATWTWGPPAVRAAAALLDRGWPALDAAIAGGQACEDDPAVRSVGYGGLPNAMGTVSLDAMGMDGRTLNCGGGAGGGKSCHGAALGPRGAGEKPHTLPRRRGASP